MEKALAKKLQEDYVPGGRSLTEEEFATLQFRTTRDDETYRCGRAVGHDIQSGPLFCGRVAEFIANTKEGMAALCSRPGHRPSRNQIDS